MSNLDMQVPRLQPKRSMELDHHLQQAQAWLAVADRSKNTAVLCYAAFEIRLAVERICMEYYIKLVGSVKAKANPNGLNFKAMKAQIFENAGNNKQIIDSFEFTRALLRVLNIAAKAPTPDMGRLSAIWHDCSEACHVFWNCGAATGKWPSSYTPQSDLEAYIAELEVFTDATATWMRVQDASFEALQVKFTAERMSDEELKHELSKNGAFAVIERSDGTKQFVGTPIPPRQPGSEDDV